MSHSPEPWSVGGQLDSDRGPIGTEIRAGTDLVAGALFMRRQPGDKYGEGWCGTPEQPEGEANLARIVACVNFCRGIPTELLAADNLAAIEKILDAR